MKTTLLSISEESRLEKGIAKKDAMHLDVLLCENGELAIPLSMLPGAAMPAFLCMMADGEPIIQVGKRQFVRTSWARNEYKDNEDMIKYLDHVDETDRNPANYSFME